MIDNPRTDATFWLSAPQILRELDALKFAVTSLVALTPAGSYERGNAANAARGIERRIDYLHDGVRHLIATAEEITAVAQSERR